MGALHIQFNGRGSRLLCIERNQPVALYDLTKADQHVYLTAPGFKVGSNGNGCFVGKDDELVASGSKLNGKIFIWHVPEDNDKDFQVVDEALFTLEHGSRVNGVCYNSTACALASTNQSFLISEIKFWTPLQLPPSFPFPHPDESITESTSFIYIGEQDDTDMSGTDDSNNQDEDDSEMSAESASEEDQEDEVSIGNNDEAISIEEYEDYLEHFFDLVSRLSEENNHQDTGVNSEAEDCENQQAADLKEEGSVFVSSSSGRWQVL